MDPQSIWVISMQGWKDKLQMSTSHGRGCGVTCFPGKWGGVNTSFEENLLVPSGGSRCQWKEEIVILSGEGGKNNLLQNFGLRHKLAEKESYGTVFEI
ncbi:hypothetical protein ACH5RR_015401 [Cinchona calisaya]|uniref:Uncharacterized protein n=1 Tax=Cinchona calisaya TaxID=153742 RepID=A0ABD2ZT27_9GENT